MSSEGSDQPSDTPWYRRLQWEDSLVPALILLALIVGAIQELGGFSFFYREITTREVQINFGNAAPTTPEIPSEAFPTVLPAEIVNDETGRYAFRYYRLESLTRQVYGNRLSGEAWSLILKATIPNEDRATAYQVGEQRGDPAIGLNFSAQSEAIHLAPGAPLEIVFLGQTGQPLVTGYFIDGFIVSHTDGTKPQARLTIEVINRLPVYDLTPFNPPS